MATKTDTETRSATMGTNDSSADTSDRPDSGRSGTRGRAADAYQSARERTASAYQTARKRASEATKTASEQVSVYPVGAVIGGLAIGALLAFLVPKTQREEQLFGATGKKLTGAARDAAQRGLDAGKEQVEQIRDRATQKVGEAVVEAVTGKA